MSDEKKQKEIKKEVVSAPIGRMHFEMMEDCIAFEQQTKPKYGKTDLLRDLLAERHKQLPEEFKSKK